MNLDDEETPRPNKQGHIPIERLLNVARPNFSNFAVETLLENRLGTLYEDGPSAIRNKSIESGGVNDDKSESSSHKRRRDLDEISSSSRKEKHRRVLREVGQNSDISSESSISLKSDSSYQSVTSSRSAFSDRVKAKVEQLAQQSCWICGNEHSSLDVCHVIAKADPAFQDLKARGIISFSSRASIDNAIPLCKRCHDGFDAIRPQCIILPLDLEYFLQFENRDFQLRSEEPLPRRRITPSADDYRAHLMNNKYEGMSAQSIHELENDEQPGGLYQIYLREDILGTRRRPTPLGKYDDPRVWHGSPTALILHAAKVLSCTDSTGWISEHTLDVIFSIIRAWSREPLPVTTKTETIEVNETTVEVSQESHSIVGNTTAPAKDLQSVQSEQGPSSLADSQPRDAVSSVTSVSTSASHSEGWKWGPNYTANHVMNLYSGPKQSFHRILSSAVTPV